jgi:hypothetical protein
MNASQTAGLGRAGVLLAFLMALFITGGLAQQAAPTMNETPQHVAPLRLVVSSSKERIRQNESFVLEVKLVNTSSENVSLFGQLLWGHAGGLTVHVSDQNGQVVEAEQHDDDMLVPSVLGNPESYVVLLPDHLLGIERKDSPKNLFHKPGVYSLFVEYQSPVPARYAKTPNFWGRESGSVRSAVIHIQVTKE